MPPPLSNGRGGMLRLGSVLEQTTPGFATMKDFFLRWLNLDVTTIAVAITAFGAISTGTQQLKYVAGHVYRWITRLFTASVSISGNDRLNREVLNWVGAKVLLHQETRILTATSEIIQNPAWDYRRVQNQKSEPRQVGKRLPIQYLPTFGITWFFHDRNIFLVRRIRSSHHDEQLLGFDSPDQYVVPPSGHEPLVVMCLGRSVAPIKRFLDTCREFAEKQRDDAFVTVRTTAQAYGKETWDNTVLRPIRPLNTVHMDMTVKEDLVQDITNYLNPTTRRFYATRGIPYRRGYLFVWPSRHGENNLDLHILHVPALISDNELERLFHALPPKCIVLLEDIDAIGVKRQPLEQDETKKTLTDRLNAYAKRTEPRGRISLSGLLNALDGVTSQEGRIVLMTANVADNLDEALVRPGRIDKMVFMGRIDREAAKEMFVRMFEGDQEATGAQAGMEKEELLKLAATFSERLPRAMFTPAQLQGFLLDHRGQPAAAVAGMEQWMAAEQQRMDETAVRAEGVAKLKAGKPEARVEESVFKPPPLPAGILKPKPLRGVVHGPIETKADKTDNREESATQLKPDKDDDRKENTTKSTAEMSEIVDRMQMEAEQKEAARGDRVIDVVYIAQLDGTFKKSLAEYPAGWNNPTS
ncbi:hypothetical protein PG993_015237 [Apiospora rasikravindrae]|uniref:BCS1 N-terminal domain-containing protein n=1 Tax=Apiospora rasikravindrae TaxID=990691 RepID=A0ABR1RQ38_9PEZI